MEAMEIQPWLFRVEPLEGESLSHFLGRFRRANELTPTGLGKMARLGGAIATKQGTIEQAITIKQTTIG